MIVSKFGGTSVADAEAITRTAEIIRGRRERRPVVIVSALAGVTNDLLAVAEHAVQGELLTAMQAVEALRRRHFQTAEKLLGPAEAAELCAEMSVMFDELASLAGALSVLGHLTPRSLDSIAATGELLSSQIVVAAYNKLGLNAGLVDARQVVITDDAYTKAVPHAEAIQAAARETILPLLREGRIPVLGGFVGATATGITTTLGRGGSDYSAALVGAALDAEAIEIWTDVDGMLTADPRIVEGARLIEQIRFDEASELASFGAKVLHPSTIAPAVRRGIPVYVYNSLRPSGTGTRITFEAPRRPVSAIAGKKGTTIVKVRSSRMLLSHGFLRTIFEVFERHRTSIDVVATSEVSVSVTVDQTERLDAILVDLATLGDVSVERSRGIIAIVGAGLNDDTVAMAKAMQSLQGIKVHMLSLSATGINFTLIVDADDVAPAMRRLHAAFFSSP
ncbi:MAG TPA: lysine-sensitive aspartokinase 3 [Gemmatimonadaceae bacterium]|nr:lysine-sensitive aspartokinase 3 [Gemmatimonadaceae bacterium]